MISSQRSSSFLLLMLASILAGPVPASATEHGPQSTREDRRSSTGARPDPPPANPGCGGLPNLTNASNQLFEIIGSMGAPDAPMANATAAMHNGVLVVPFAVDGASDGGIAFFDITDPFNPSLVHNVFRSDVREGHSIGFHYTGTACYAATLADVDAHIWDWTDVTNPVLLANMVLPDVLPSDYNNGAWWLFWQAPYLYVAGSSRGLYIVDTTDPASPVLLNRVAVSKTSGFRLGTIFAIGNLLVLSGNADVAGLTTMEISDPVNPVLLATDTLEVQYSKSWQPERRFRRRAGRH